MFRASDYPLVAKVATLLESYSKGTKERSKCTLVRLAISEVIQVKKGYGYIGCNIFVLRFPAQLPDGYYVCAPSKLVFYKIERDSLDLSGFDIIGQWTHLTSWFLDQDGACFLDQKIDRPLLDFPRKSTELYNLVMAHTSQGKEKFYQYYDLKAIEVITSFFALNKTRGSRAMKVLIEPTTGRSERMMACFQGGMMAVIMGCRFVCEQGKEG